MLPIAIWNEARDCWESMDQIDLLSEHSDVYSETFPPSAMTQGSFLYALPTSVPPMEGTGYSSLPSTPTLSANVAENGGSQAPSKRRAGGHQPSIQDEAEYLPTLKASDGEWGTPMTSGRPKEAATHISTRVATLPTLRATRGGPGTETLNLLGMPLSILTQMLPTPQAHDAVKGKTAEQVEQMRARGPASDTSPPKSSNG